MRTSLLISARTRPGGTMDVQLHAGPISVDSWSVHIRLRPDRGTSSRDKQRSVSGFARRRRYREGKVLLATTTTIIQRHHEGPFDFVLAKIAGPLEFIQYLPFQEGDYFIAKDSSSWQMTCHWRTLPIAHLPIVRGSIITHHKELKRRRR